MKTSIVGRILMAIIFASVIGGLSAGPALGENDKRGQGQSNKAGTTIAVGRKIAVGTTIAIGRCTGTIGTNRSLFMPLRRLFMPRSHRRASASFSLRSTFDRGILNVDRRLLTAALLRGVVSNRARQDKIEA